MLQTVLDGLDYEDELDLATACHVSQIDGGEQRQGHLCFYDNATGRLVKRMAFDEVWEEVKFDNSYLPRITLLVHFGNRISNSRIMELYQSHKIGVIR